MRLLTPENAESYLRAQGRLGDNEPVSVRELAGGVSNMVLHVARPQTVGGDLVLKQALPQLRVPDAWFCSVERIWREVETLRCCQRLLASAPVEESPAQEIRLPAVLWEDRDQFLFAMTAAPPRHGMWKERLLASTAGDDAHAREVADACGRLLGRLHAAGWQDAETARRLEDRTFFEDLRIAPYYRHVARLHPDLAPALQALIDSVWQSRLTLVHGDFSPKNLLVYDGGLMLIDFEVGHFGDPAFDLGFFLTHLVLKSAYHAPRCEPMLALADRFCAAYRLALQKTAAEGQIGPQELTALEARAARNLGGCLLARIDGKSQVGYLQQEERRQAMRQLAAALLTEPNLAAAPLPLSAALQTAGRAIAALRV